MFIWRFNQPPDYYCRSTSKLLDGFTQRSLLWGLDSDPLRRVMGGSLPLVGTGDDFMNDNLNDRYVIGVLIKERCLEAARCGYEEASLSGLCEEGRIEAALDAIRSLDVTKVINEHEGE